MAKRNPVQVLVDFTVAQISAAGDSISPARKTELLRACSELVADEKQAASFTIWASALETADMQQRWFNFRSQQPPEDGHGFPKGPTPSEDV